MNTATTTLTHLLVAFVTSPPNWKRAGGTPEGPPRRPPAGGRGSIPGGPAPPPTRGDRQSKAPGTRLRGPRGPHRSIVGVGHSRAISQPPREAGLDGPSSVCGRGRCRLEPGVGPAATGRCRSRVPQVRASFSKVILRKEVIQPQVPLRLPCYDLVPITGFTFGACLAAPATSDAPRFGGLTGGVYKAQEHIHRGMLIRDY